MNITTAILYFAIFSIILMPASATVAVDENIEEINILNSPERSNFAAMVEDVEPVELEIHQRTMFQPPQDTDYCEPNHNDTGWICRGATMTTVLDTYLKVQ